MVVAIVSLPGVFCFLVFDRFEKWVEKSVREKVLKIANDKNESVRTSPLKMCREVVP